MTTQTIDVCWCCGTPGIEHEPYLEVTSMSAERAQAFAMPNAYKVICVGQADPVRYRFGARTYRLFENQKAWERYNRSGR